MAQAAPEGALPLPQSPDRCPLAVYTGRRVGVFVMTSPTTPPWVKPFVNAVDECGQKTIGGKKALEILMRTGYRKA